MLPSPSCPCLHKHLALLIPGKASLPLPEVRGRLLAKLGMLLVVPTVPGALEQHSHPTGSLSGPGGSTSSVGPESCSVAFRKAKSRELGICSKVLAPDRLHSCFAQGLDKYFFVLIPDKREKSHILPFITSELCYKLITA